MMMSKSMTIDMDDREPIEYVALFNQLGWWVNRKRIDKDAGAYDYMWNNVGIERKAINDLMGSVRSKDKHMWEQLNRMSTDDFFSYLIIDGKVYEELDKSRYTYKQFYGAKGSINTRYANIKMDTAHNGEAFVYLVNKIFLSHKEGKHGKQRSDMVSHTAKIDMPTEVLSLIPRLHTKAADISRELNLVTLHDICGLIDRKKEFIAVPDVGPKTFENMKEKFLMGD